MLCNHNINITAPAPPTTPTSAPNSPRVLSLQHWKRPSSHCVLCIIKLLAVSSDKKPFWQRFLAAEINEEGNRAPQNQLFCQDFFNSTYSQRWEAHRFLAGFVSGFVAVAEICSPEHLSFPRRIPQEALHHYSALVYNGKATIRSYRQLLTKKQ